LLILNPRWWNAFDPTRSGHRLKTVLFPVDTDEEQARFQMFLNEHEVVHLALSTGAFREVLAVYK